MMVRVSKRTNDPVGLRNRVLDVAARAFQTSGYTSTSMQDLVREAGISGGALHHHFPTKKDLALAVVSERVSAEVAQTWIATVQEAQTAACGILAVFDQVATTLKAQGSVSGCPLGNLALELSLADDDMRAAIGHEYQAWRGAIAKRLAEEGRAGRAAFAQPDPDAFATMVVSLFSGAMGVAKVEQQPHALVACGEHLRRVMADDLPITGFEQKSESRT